MELAPLAVLGDLPRSADATKRFIPHVVAWNLTRRCNLACAHCYIAAGPEQTAADDLTTEEVRRITDQILAINKSPMFILSGGEPLLREDLNDIASYQASRGATVVVGTNGTLLTEERIVGLQGAGVSGVAVSVESLDPTYHDRFRRGHGSLDATLEAVERLATLGLDFVVQTTVTRGNHAELASLVAWAAERGAVAFNTYFLVTTGRGAGMHALSPEEHEDTLTELVSLHREYLGRMMVRAKCAPHFMRLVHQHVPDSPLLNYPTRCPCGVQYCRVTPDGNVTACPYLPLPAGNLREATFAEVWERSSLFGELRGATLGGKCGRCEYRAVCGGCRARAYATTGDHLSEDPSCVYEPPATVDLVEPRTVAYGDDAVPTMEWTAEAQARINRIPSFVRAVVVSRVEAFARREGHSMITPELLADVRRQLPVDFSKRVPFFLRHDD